MEQTWTCQICGRVIKAKNGKIAHHGYQRPGNGWQTASCFGARYRPYEVASDALPPAIVNCTAYIERVSAVIADQIANPPRSIEVALEGGNFRFKYKAPYTLLRPDGFDPAAEVGYTERSMLRPYHSYEMTFRNRQAERASQVAAAKGDLEFLNKRLAAWKPAA